MTDGKPSDMGLYKEELERLKQNKWFQYSTRAGIAIEEGALSPECKRVLMEFTENDKNVYEAKNTIILAKQIELVTLTGVDFVTQQGSIQNTNTGVAQTSPTFHSTSTPASTPTPQPARPNRPAPAAPNPQPTIQTPQPESASPTLPIGEIDWEHDFDF